MAALFTCPACVRSLKNVLRDRFPASSSSHVSEALAAALGFRTHAALVANQRASQPDWPILLVDDRRFLDRLGQLGDGRVDQAFSFEELDFAAAELIDTGPGYGADIPRLAQAFRNLMVLTVNWGLRQKLFSLKPGDNRWRDDDDRSGRFRFSLPTGEPASGWVADAGRHSLKITAAVNLVGEPKDRPAVLDADKTVKADQAVAVGWLEREKGAWLDASSGMTFSVGKSLAPVLTGLDVTPLGFGDRGWSSPA
ncbi:hypothetical protein [Variovorax saccharolyticus]|uniref:hypothetical protein n=1 Tax=Variovorax saccharolyticus TaxID=3053516 RepID=UPI002575890D|nr:hypothetical protein [Variovorax sp. J31P216]MDM0029862.1 hypothetical protein [Variovorax sp. J31P216]